MCRRQRKRSSSYFWGNIYHCVVGMSSGSTCSRNSFIYISAVYVLCLNASAPTLDISKWRKRDFYEPYPVKQAKVKNWYTTFVYISVHKEQSLISESLRNEIFTNINSVLIIYTNIYKYKYYIYIYTFTNINSGHTKSNFSLLWLWGNLSSSK